MGFELKGGARAFVTLKALNDPTSACDPLAVRFGLYRSETQTDTVTDIILTSFPALRQCSRTCYLCYDEQAARKIEIEEMRSDGGGETRRKSDAIRDQRSRHNEWRMGKREKHESGRDKMHTFWREL